MSDRAEQVARNDRKVLNAMADLWLELPMSELTLDKVAERSGVTVRTILRKFGSKEGLFKACIENDAERFTHERMQVIPGDLNGILDALLEEYERMGDALIRTLTREYSYPSTQALLRKAATSFREDIRAGDQKNIALREIGGLIVPKNESEVSLEELKVRYA